MLKSNGKWVHALRAVGALVAVLTLLFSSGCGGGVTGEGRVVALPPSNGAGGTSGEADEVEPDPPTGVVNALPYAVDLIDEATQGYDFAVSIGDDENVVPVGPLPTPRKGDVVPIKAPPASRHIEPVELEPVATSCDPKYVTPWIGIVPNRWFSDWEFVPHWQRYRFRTKKNWVYYIEVFAHPNGCWDDNPDLYVKRSRHMSPTNWWWRCRRSKHYPDIVFFKSRKKGYMYCAVKARSGVGGLAAWLIRVDSRWNGSG